MKNEDIESKKENVYDVDRSDENFDNEKKINDEVIDGLSKFQIKEFLKIKGKIFFLYFIVGTFSDYGYILVSSGAQDLAEKFKHESLMPLFLFSLIVFSGSTKKKF